nr:hypothetical protein [Candidatus Njordarchaeum guaymaensis]
MGEKGAKKAKASEESEKKGVKKVKVSKELGEKSVKKVKVSHPEEPYVKRVFGFAVTATFGLELISILVIIGSLVTFLISISGLLQILSFDVQLLLLLIASGVAFLIIIIFAGFFIRENEVIQDKILTPGIFYLSRVTYEARALLALFGISLILFCSAGVYGYYLLWSHVLGLYVGGYLSLTTLFVALGTFFVSLLAQIIIALVGRYALRLEKVGKR